VDPLLPEEKAGFRRGRATVDQVILLTQKTKDSFLAKKKAGAVFVDLTAAYDTVWYRGLTCKLLRLLLDRHMVSFIMELVLAPLLFNIYTHDLPTTTSRKFAFADDLAIMYSARKWHTLVSPLNQNMATLFTYLQN